VRREYQHVRIETLLKKLSHSINVVVLYCIHKHLILLWYCRRRCFIIRCMGSENWRGERKTRGAEVSLILQTQRPNAIIPELHAAGQEQVFPKYKYLVHCEEPVSGHLEGLQPGPELPLADLAGSNLSTQRCRGVWLLCMETLAATLFATRLCLQLSPGGRICPDWPLTCP